MQFGLNILYTVSENFDHMRMKDLQSYGNLKTLFSSFANWQISGEF